MKFQTINELIQYRDNIEHNLNKTRLQIDRGDFNDENRNNAYRRLAGMKSEINKIDILMSHILNEQYDDVMKASEGVLYANEDMFYGISTGQCNNTEQMLDLFHDNILLTKNEVQSIKTEAGLIAGQIKREDEPKAICEESNKEGVLQDRTTQVEHKQVDQRVNESKEGEITRISVNPQTGEIKQAQDILGEFIQAISHKTSQENIKEEKLTVEHFTGVPCFIDIIKPVAQPEETIKDIVDNSVRGIKFIYSEAEKDINNRMPKILDFLFIQKMCRGMRKANILFDIVPKLVSMDGLAKLRAFLNETIFRTLFNSKNPVLAFLQVKMVFDELDDIDCAKIVRKAVFAELNPDNKIKYDEFLMSHIVPLYSTKGLIWQDARTQKFMEIVYGNLINRQEKFEQIWMLLDLVPAHTRSQITDPIVPMVEAKSIEFKHKVLPCIISNKQEKNQPVFKPNDIQKNAQIIHKQIYQIKNKSYVARNYNVKR